MSEFASIRSLKCHCFAFVTHEKLSDAFHAVTIVYLKLRHCCSGIWSAKANGKPATQVCWFTYIKNHFLKHIREKKTNTIFNAKID